MTRIDELETTLAITSNRRTLRKKKMAVLTTVTRRNIREEGIFMVAVKTSDFGFQVY
jgi:hypothetical protein